jgi:2-polyprenyl-3-methyl-5-hydroxy-6-metoxy-1,4-benzoquinol methylase
VTAADQLPRYKERLDRCPGCGSLNVRDESSRNSICSCADCELLFTNPRPTQEFVRSNYCDGEYYARFTPDHNWEGMWRRRVRRVTRRLTGGSVLDVGAGIGTQLSMLRQLGFKVTGTEISTEAVQRAKALYGLQLLHGYVEDVSLHGYVEDVSLEPGYDAITLWHVFEHLPYPGKTLSFLVDRLRSGGFLIMAVPNTALAQLAFKPASYGKARQQKLEMLIPDVPYEKTFSEIHLIHFTPDSLRRIVTAAGLQLVELNHDNISLRPSFAKDVKYAVRNVLAGWLHFFPHKALFVCARKP